MPRFRPDFVDAWKEIETGGARAAVIIATEYVEDALEGISRQCEPSGGFICRSVESMLWRIGEVNVWNRRIAMRFVPATRRAWRYGILASCISALAGIAAGVQAEAQTARAATQPQAAVTGPMTLHYFEGRVTLPQFPPRSTC